MCHVQYNDWTNGTTVEEMKDYDNIIMIQFHSFITPHYWKVKTNLTKNICLHNQTKYLLSHSRQSFCIFSSRNSALMRTKFLFVWIGCFSKAKYVYHDFATLYLQFSAALKIFPMTGLETAFSRQEQSPCIHPKINIQLPFLQKKRMQSNVYETGKLSHSQHYVNKHTFHWHPI